MSMLSRHATALEVCDFVYGELEELHEEGDVLDRFYEANASMSPPLRFFFFTSSRLNYFLFF
jgi:hypothetical protein